MIKAMQTLLDVARLANFQSEAVDAIEPELRLLLERREKHRRRPVLKAAVTSLENKLLIFKSRYTTIKKESKTVQEAFREIIEDESE